MRFAKRQPDDIQKADAAQCFQYFMIFVSVPMNAKVGTQERQE